MGCMTSLVVAIITWNNIDDALECAESLLAQENVDDFVVLFVDNDSRASEQIALKDYISSRKDSRIGYTQTGYNGGTAGGFNAAVRWAKKNGAEYVGSLNADAIADPNWLSALHAELTKHDDSAISTGIMLHRDGQTIDTTGDFYTTWGLPGPRGRNQPASHAPTEAGYVFGATGGGFLARTSLYDDIGYYDERMFMYYEDIDLSFRSQLAGHKVRYTPSAVGYHKRGAASDTVPGLASYNTFKNLPILYVKNVPLSLWPTMYPRFVLMYTLIMIKALLSNNRLAAFKGYLASWRHLIHMFRERRRIQSARTVTNQYVSDIIMHDIPPDQTGLRRFRSFFTGKL